MTESNNKKHKVSIILVNYNAWQYSVACVESIIAKVRDDLDFNIIIVDNNSVYEDYNKLSSICSRFYNVTLIRSTINLGFSGGNMLGVQHASADYLLFLNNDTIFLKDNVSILLDFMLKQKNAGICTGQMFNGEGVFETSFGYFPSLYLRILGANVLRIFSPKKYPNNRIVYSEPQQVDFVSGALMFVDFNCFAYVGGFDTNYFLYCEEEDIAMKMHKAGFSAYLVPEAKYVHYMGKSTTKNIDVDKEFYISLFYYLRKYTTRLEYFIFVLYCFLKIIKYFYKDTHYIQLAFFILSFPGHERSMKHKQRIIVN